MNLPLFISQRLIASKKHQNSISAPIIKIGIVSIALGIVVMLIAIATGTGLQKKIKEKVSGFNGHIQIVNFDTNQSSFNLVPIENNQELINQLKLNKAIQHIQSFAKKAGIIKTAVDFEGIIVKGVDAQYDWNFFKDYLIEGQIPSYKDSISNEVLLSKTLADNLHLKLNDTIKVWFVREEADKPPLVRSWKIKGIYNTGFPDFDNSYLIADIKHLQKINKWEKNQVGGIELFVNDFSQIDAIGKKIYSEIPTNLNSTTVVEQFQMIFEWISLFDKNIYVIITLMIFVAGFNIITALLVLILEQTRMIGILKAMGAANHQIRKIFIYQATYLVVRGLIWGNVIGIGLLLLQKYFGIVSLNPETYYVNTAPVYLHLTYIVVLNIGVVAVTYLMLIIPSFYITKISPVKAIKFE